MQNFNNTDLDKENLEKKKWLFKESVRIENEKKEIANARKAIETEKAILQNQKNFFEKQWKILEIEIRKLVIDQEKFQKEKCTFRDQIYRETRKSSMESTDTSIFFRGITDIITLKKRYKDLLKIYHPDNLNGDHFVLLRINEEYEKLCKSYALKSR